MSASMAIRTSAPEVCMTANLSPRRPVCVQVQGPDAVLWVRAARQPSAVAVAAKPGCARYPRDWAGYINE
eukprot:1958711-Pyramimonas_sp.AAC.1